jgi:hypothetical protein
VVALHIDRGLLEALWLALIVAIVIGVGVISARIVTRSGSRRITRRRH